MPLLLEMFLDGRSRSTTCIRSMASVMKPIMSSASFRANGGSFAIILVLDFS